MLMGGILLHTICVVGPVAEHFVVFWFTTITVVDLPVTLSNLGKLLFVDIFVLQGKVEALWVDDVIWPDGS